MLGAFNKGYKKLNIGQSNLDEMADEGGNDIYGEYIHLQNVLLI